MPKGNEHFKVSWIVALKKLCCSNIFYSDSDETNFQSDPDTGQEAEDEYETDDLLDIKTTYKSISKKLKAETIANRYLDIV